MAKKHKKRKSKNGNWGHVNKSQILHSDTHTQVCSSLLKNPTFKKSLISKMREGNQEDLTNADADTGASTNYNYIDINHINNQKLDLSNYKAYDLNSRNRRLSTQSNLNLWFTPGKITGKTERSKQWIYQGPHDQPQHKRNTSTHLIQKLRQSGLVPLSLPVKRWKYVARVNQTSSYIFAPLYLKSSTSKQDTKKEMCDRLAAGNFISCPSKFSSSSSRADKNMSKRSGWTHLCIPTLTSLFFD